MLCAAKTDDGALFSGRCRLKFPLEVKAFLFLLGFLFAQAQGAEKSVRVFIALCDNKSQGIIPVGEKIGNGDNPDANLYWGCSESFGAYFKASKEWRMAENTAEVTEPVLRRMVLKSKEVQMTAEAYRGSAIRKCIEDFERAAASGENDLVAFIGHNGLMDFSLPEPPAGRAGKTDAIVLCCMSDRYFRSRLEKMGCRPILLTQQLMYPGSFLLHDALHIWLRAGSRSEIRAAAGQAYARNQKISIRAATGVFAALE